MDDQQLIIQKHDSSGILTLTLNRPHQYNALSQIMLAEMQSALDSTAMDQSVRVLIIAGAGNAFCAGHDLKEMRANPDPAFIEGLFKQCSRMMMTLTRIPQPVIARVHGLA